MTNILLIKDDIKDYSTFISHIKSDIKVYNDISEITDKQNVQRIGIIWTNNGDIQIPFLIEEINESNIETYIPDARKMEIDFFNSFPNLVNVDLITCNINNQDWINYITKIESETNINIRYSLDRTGNGDDADWVLESDNIDLIQEDILFSASIFNYPYIFDGAASASSIGDFFTDGDNNILPFKYESDNVSGGKNIMYDSSQGTLDNNSYIELQSNDIVDGMNNVLIINAVRTTHLFKTNLSATDMTIKNMEFKKADNNVNFTPIGDNSRYLIIENISNNCGIAQNKGGIIGKSCFNMNISNCHYNGLINNFSSGGIIGKYFKSFNNYTSVIKNCYYSGENNSVGTISGNGSGGIIGSHLNYYSSNGTIDIINCYSRSNVTAQNSGGIIGSHLGSGMNNSTINIKLCYTTGDISGRWSGGIFGALGLLATTNKINNIFVEECYTGYDKHEENKSKKINGESAGGIFGRNFGLAVTTTGSLLTIKNCITYGSLYYPSLTSPPPSHGGFLINNCKVDVAIENCLFYGKYEDANGFMTTEPSSKAYIIRNLPPTPNLIKNNVSFSSTPYLNYDNATNELNYTFSDLFNATLFNSFKTYFQNQNFIIIITPSSGTPTTKIIFNVNSSRSSVDPNCIIFTFDQNSKVDQNNYLVINYITTMPSMNVKALQLGGINGRRLVYDANDLKIQASDATNVVKSLFEGLGGDVSTAISIGSKGVAGNLADLFKAKDDLISDLADEVADRISAVAAEQSSRIAKDSELQSNIDAEEAAREAKDNALQSNIDDEVSDRKVADASIVTKLANVESELISADGSLQSNIDDEVSDRKVADASITLRLSNEEDAHTINKISLDTRLGQEENKRMNDDASLTTRLSDEEVNRSNAVSSEKVAREAADASLTTRLSHEEVARDSVDTVLSDALNAAQMSNNNFNGSLHTRLVAEEVTRSNAVFAEISEREAADTSLTTRLSQEEVSCSNAVSAEKAAREAADNSLTTRLGAEESAREAADNALQSNIDNEKTSRESTDASLAVRLSDDEDARVSADGSIDFKLSQEINARSNADTSLSNALSTETSTRIVKDTSLTTRLGDEESDRAAADSTLQSNIDNEESAREAADTSLTTRLGAEEVARAAEDSTLQSNIDDEESAREAADTSLTSRLSAEESARAALDTALSNALSVETSARASTDVVLQNADSSLASIDSHLVALVAGTDINIGQLESVVNVYNGLDTDVVDRIYNITNTVNQLVCVINEAFEYGDGDEISEISPNTNISA